MSAELSDEEPAAHHQREANRYARIVAIRTEKNKIRDDANARIKALDEEEARLRGQEPSSVSSV